MQKVVELSIKKFYSLGGCSNPVSLYIVCVYPISSIYWSYKAIILTIQYNTINLLFHLITYETERFYFRQTSILMSI